jgi:hypothetical protein
MIFIVNINAVVVVVVVVVEGENILFYEHE